MKNFIILTLLILSKVNIFLFTSTISASEIYSEVIVTSKSHLQTNQSSEELKSNVIYTRRLDGSEKHFFTVRAEVGKCLRFLVEQNGIDMMIAIKDAEKKALKEVDRPSGSFGRETVTFIVPHTGSYTIEIKAWRAHAIAGNYQISYTVAEVPTESDKNRDLAENLTSEAEILRGEGSKENKEKALQKFAEALTVWRELGDTFEQAVVYYGIGYTNYGLSNYYEAARFYHRALRLHLENGDEFGQALNHSALSAVEYALNENEFAFYNIQKAIEIYKKIGNVRGLGINFHALGTAQFLSERYDEAIASLTESLRWRVLANDSLGKARTHISLGKIHLYLKDYGKARQQFLEAQKSLGEPRAAKDAELLYHFGRLYAATGKVDEARKHLEQSLIISNQTGNKIGVAHVLIDLSRLSARVGEMKEALGYIQNALDLIEQARQGVLDYRTRINFFASVQPFYQHYVSLLMKMHEQQPDKGFDRRALEISEQSRNRGLLDQLERRQMIKQGKVHPKLLERERQLRDELTELLAQSGSYDSLQKKIKIQEISSQFIEIESEIHRQLDSPKSVLLPTLTVEKIQSYLDENTVLLEYHLDKTENFLWIVSNSKVKSFRLAGGEKIDDEAKAVFGCFSEPVSIRGNEICRRKIISLSEKLLRQVAGDIQNRRLIIIKQGFLQYIPFSALFSPTSQDYLIKTNEIVTLPSASILSFIRQTKSEEAPEKTLALFGDPIFSPEDDRLNKNSAPPNRKFYFGKDLPRLFASRLEVEGISTFVPAEKLLIKTDASASRQAIFEENLKDYRILHFATHTLINDWQPEISAIVLSLFAEDGKSINGFVRSNDILRIDLDADLVVLSSCRSGAGKQIKGEGMISLANSFFAAGARHLLVSLWDVNDKVTAELMLRFYRKHLKERKSFSVSLRESQIEIMSDKRWNAPYYWSAFVLNGD